MTSILTKRREKAILLLDSLEQYPTRLESVENALSGLLMCVGQFNERNEVLNVRLCLPAELYHVFPTTNPIKDLARALFLRWISGELLSVAARRLRHYLRLYLPEEFKPWNSVNFENREDVQKLLHAYLPEQITNGLGCAEQVTAYVLRHTQLQPRHLLMFLNAIFEKERKSTHSTYPRISETSVKSAIRENEHLLCEEVFSGYQTLYPTAKVVCEACIPELPITFSNSKLQQVFNRVGKRAFGQNDYWDFRRSLIETGIVGRVTDETDRYMIGRFEYTEPHKLLVSTADTLCLHPVFAQVFNYDARSIKKTVYPYGCDPQAEDNREWPLE